MVYRYYVFMRKTQRKGDTAVTQALATFTKIGCDVSLPITESAPYDIIVDDHNALHKVQVRFTSSDEVDLRRIHSNASGYVIKKPKKGAYDWLYVLNSDNEEFLITIDLSGRRSIKPQKKDLFQTERWPSGRRRQS